MTGLILRLLLGGFLIAHGLLHWHFDISRSWLLRGTGLVKSQPVRSSAALLWILASTGFFVTGLSLMGFPVLHEWWRSLAITSAFVSLVLLVLAWHPWLTPGVLIDTGILVALLWGNLLPEG